MLGGGARLLGAGPGERFGIELQRPDRLQDGREAAVRLTSPPDDVLELTLELGHARGTAPKSRRLHRQRLEHPHRFTDHLMACGVVARCRHPGDRLEFRQPRHEPLPLRPQRAALRDLNFQPSLLRREFRPFLLELFACLFQGDKFRRLLPQLVDAPLVVDAIRLDLFHLPVEQAQHAIELIPQGPCTGRAYSVAAHAGESLALGREIVELRQQRLAAALRIR